MVKKKGYLVEGVKITPIFVRITHPLKGTKKKDPIETKKTPHFSLQDHFTFPSIF